MFLETMTLTGIPLEMLPSSISKVPFEYLDVPSSKTYDMTFAGGITCVIQHQEDGTLEPKVGWAVLENGLKQVGGA